MKEFNYKMCFSPYTCLIYAKSLKQAKSKIKKMYPEYDTRKTLQYLS